MRKPVLSLALLAIGWLLSAVSAQAQPIRAYVALTGSDANPCTFASPCKSAQHAHDVVAAGGEVRLLDPGSYGLLTITKAISILGDGHGGIAAQNNNSAITISAGANDRINLRGLVLEGFGTGATGISFISGASLNIQDTIIRNFKFNGIAFITASAAELHVSQTLISDLDPANGFAIEINAQPGSPGLNAFLDHVTLKIGDVGLAVENQSTGNLNVAISDSIISKYVYGVLVSPPTGPINVVVRNCTVTNNGTGILSQGSPTHVRVTKSTITANGTGLSSASSGSLISYGDNNIDGNTTDGAPTSTTLLK